LGQETPATVVHHHIKRWNPDTYVDENNFVALCGKHHNDIHNGDAKVKKLIDKVMEHKHVL